MKPSERLFSGDTVSRILDEEAVEGSIVDQDFVAYDTGTEFEEAVREQELVRMDIPGIPWTLYIDPQTGMYRAFFMVDKGTIYAEGFKTIADIVQWSTDLIT